MLADRYRIEEEIGSGGLAVVWRATDTLLGRQVALKLLNPATADDTGRTRLREEAVSAAAIHHPNVVTVYDLGEEDDQIYIVMEHVDGPSLDEVLVRHGRLDPEVAAAIGVQCAEALGAAHERGLVHRDVKPANILLSPEGTVKVVDFGIAKALDDPHTTLTRTGTVMGTAAYLAPEQLTEAAVDGRADLYALGLVLLECISGQAVFTGETTVEVALARLERDPPRARDLRPDVPPGLDETIDRATARDAADRWPDAASLAAALGADAAGDATSRLRALVHGDEPEGVAPDDATRPIQAYADDHDRGSAFVGALDLLRRAPAVTRTLGIVAATALAAILLVVVGMRVTDQATEPAPDDETEGPVAVEVTNSGDHDPFGSGEHPDRVAHVHDGDAQTTWTTQRYTTADFGGLKPGVGVWLDVGEPRTVRAVEIVLATPGVDLRVYAMDDPPGADPGAWGEVRAHADGAEGEVRLELEPVEARFWLVWLTRLPAEGGRYRAEISQIRLLGE